MQSLGTEPEQDFVYVRLKFMRHIWIGPRVLKEVSAFRDDPSPLCSSFRLDDRGIEKQMLVAGTPVESVDDLMGSEASV